MFFIMILLVTMFAFGVIKTSILYPQSPLSWNILNQVLYQPYFQMYGELFLEDESQYSDCELLWLHFSASLVLAPSNRVGSLIISVLVEIFMYFDAS